MPGAGRALVENEKLPDVGGLSGKTENMLSCGALNCPSSGQSAEDGQLRCSSPVSSNVGMWCTLVSSILRCK